MLPVCPPSELGRDIVNRCLKIPRRSLVWGSPAGSRPPPPPQQTPLYKSRDRRLPRSSESSLSCTPSGRAVPTCDSCRKSQIFSLVNPCNAPCPPTAQNSQIPPGGVHVASCGPKCCCRRRMAVASAASHRTHGRSSDGRRRAHIATQGYKSVS